MLALLLLTLIASPEKQIDEFARKAIEQIGAPPGLGVVVVSNDRILYRGGFGLREVEGQLPVTPDTRFYVGSTTKAFTAMAAAILAGQGKIDLDQPVTTYWPELRLTPPLDAARLSLRDLLAMRPGFENSTFTLRSRRISNIEDEQELLRILATYSTPVPRTFDYSNMAFEMAGQVLARATGKSWQELSEDLVFDPLGMSETTSTVPAAGLPVAHLYYSPERGLFVRNPGKIDRTMGPAGGTYTTTGDAARWLMAMLSQGRLGGRQALPRRAVQLVSSHQTTQKVQWKWFERWGFGLGEDLGSYDGDLLIHRFGAYNGAYSHVSFMPERNLGVAVFSNGGSIAADAVAAYAYDLFLGKKNLDAKWGPLIEKLAADVERGRRARAAREEPMRAQGEAARPLPDYTGTYHYHGLGTLEVRPQGRGLSARLGILEVDLIPAGGDEFYADWFSEGEPERVRFVFGESGKALRFEWGDRIFERR